MPTWSDPSPEIVSDYPARASSLRQIQANISAALDGDGAAPRLQSRRSGNSAIASEDGLVGQVLVVTDDASPDGVGKVIRPASPPVSKLELFDHFAGSHVFSGYVDGNDIALSYENNETTVWGKIMLTIGLIAGAANQVRFVGTNPVSPELFNWAVEARVKGTNWNDSGARAAVGILRPNSISDGVPRGIFFYARPGTNSGNWQVVWRQSGITVLLNTSTPATDWATLRVEYDGTTMKFLIDGTAVHTITTGDLTTTIGLLTSYATDYQLGVACGTSGSLTAGRALEVDWLLVSRGV